MRRKVSLGETRAAGVGGDGERWGVTSLTTNGKGPFVHRDKPCATCPFRRDSQVGRFPPQAYRESAKTAYDMAESTFACHESGVESPATCAGFLLVNAAHNLGVRLAGAFGRFDPRRVGNPDGVPLYGSYREMAVANGVEPDDPVLARCRGNYDCVTGDGAVPEPDGDEAEDR